MVQWRWERSIHLIHCLSCRARTQGNSLHWSSREKSNIELQTNKSVTTFLVTKLVRGKLLTAPHILSLQSKQTALCFHAWPMHFDGSLGPRHKESMATRRPHRPHSHDGWTRTGSSRGKNDICRKQIGRWKPRKDASSFSSLWEVTPKKIIEPLKKVG